VVEAAVQAAEVPSGVLAVANGRELVRCAAFSRPGGDQVTTDHIFLLASISKPMVATAIMQLVEDGRLTLGDPVTRYIPEFDRPGKPPVTVWHLLTHTAGMEETAWFEALNIARAPAVAHFLAACHSSLHFRPGTRFEYCTLSFVILGELITRLSGLPYPEYLQERVFAPLGMVDTSFDPGPGNAPRTAPVHGTEAWGEGALEYFVGTAAPGGGLWSTAADVVRFGQAFANGGARLLAPALVELMTREHTTGLVALVDGHPEAAHYGLGWSKDSLAGTLPGSPAVVEHGGATGTLLWVDPEWDLVFVFLTNHWDIQTNVPQRALQAVYGALHR
jgi:CubicO group peptidase (beta-lactamase class C family)